MPKHDDGQHGGDAKEHREHKHKPVLDPDERGGFYAQNVAEYVTEATWQRNEVSAWLKELSADGSHDLMTVEEHVSEVLKSSGITEFADRIRQVEAAVKRQQQLLLDRKNRKKERMREAATSKEPRKTDVGGGQKEEHDPKASGAGEQKTPRVGQIAENFLTAVAATDKPDVVWKEVQSFRTQDEAIRFIMECQPIDYQPEIQADSDTIESILSSPQEVFPRYENTRDALAHVLQMDPRPSEFSSMAAEFKRRLRIRKAEPDELAADHAPRQRGKSRSLLLKHRMSHSGGHHRHHEHHSTKEKKPWIVETAGVLFERPASLRDLKKDIAAAKYYIAVNKDVEKDILAEGFRVKQRCSIPCSATPQEAVAAFTRNEQKAGHAAPARASVLVVDVQGEYDVVAHKKSGFMIVFKAGDPKVLPPKYLSRIKRSEAGAV